MNCTICQSRRPRRFCPGVAGDICAPCCGTGREATVNCPLDCEYLVESRRHDRPQPLDPSLMPHPDIEITEEFVEEHAHLLEFLGGAMAASALQISGASDRDAREALDALVRTYRSLQSGVYYESRPENPMAAGICEAVQRAAAEFRRQEQESLGMARTRDADILRSLVFLARVELDRNNGRPRGRAFLHMVRQSYAAVSREAPGDGASGLILP
jgi:hypothetical protein